MYDISEISDSQYNQFTKGRIGLMVFISGIAFMMIGASLLVVKPSEDELKIIKNNLQKKEEAKELTLTEEDEFAKDDNFTLNSKDEVKDDIKDEIKEEIFLSPNQISPSPDVIYRKQFQRAGSSKLSQVQNMPAQTQKKSIFLRQVTQKKVEPQSPKSQDIVSKKDIDSQSHEQFQQLQSQQIQQEQILQHQLSSGSNNGFNQLMKYKKGNKQLQEDKESVKSHENEEENKFDIPDYLNCKNAHFETIALVTAFFTLSLLGFSYLKLFEKNIFYFLILLQFVDAIYSWILSNYLLTESMLIQPLMAILEVIQFVMFMAAESFQDFIISYFIRMALIISFRTYINPVLKNLKYFTKKLARWMITRYPQTQPYLQNFLEVTTQDKNIKFYLGLHSKQQIEFKEEQSVEHVITMILSFSSKMHAIFLKPFALVIIKMFERENQIPKLYNINFRDFDFYIYFAFVIMIPQIFIDIYVLNSLELIYGYKLYDYFHYCKYRYDFRTQKNIAHSLNLDRSISIEHRSIDNMRFTYQFYFYGTIVIFGIFCVIIGTTTIIRNNYLMFGDPVIFFHIMFIFSFLFIMQQIIQYAINKIDPLRIKDSRLKIPLDSLEEILNPVKENLEQIMEVDIIRKHFIQLNKEWIINNMSLFINQETFVEQDEFLLKIYQFLINEEKKEEKENKRLEMLAKKQKELELKSRKKSKKAAAATGTATNEDDIITEKSPKHESSIDDYSIANNSHPSKLQSSPTTQQEIIIRITKSQSERLKKLLFIWFYQAKQNLFLKSLVKEVLMKNFEEHCKKCGLDIELRVVEQIPFAKMTNSFKFKTLGSPFNKYEWIRYYEKTQKFITLCLDCEIGYRSKILQKQNRQTTTIIYNPIEKKNANEKEKGYSGSSISKSIIFTWLMIARSNLLIKKQKLVSQKKQKIE